MKNLLFLIFLLLATTIQAQNFPQNPNKIDKNNLKQGLWTLLYDEKFNELTNKSSVTYCAVGELIDGKLNGNWVYYDGKTMAKKMEMSFQNGVKNGIASTYHDNGKLNSQGLFANGIRNGLWYYYHSNGQTRLELMMRDNLRIGISKEYDETGKLIKETEYENGKPKEMPKKTNQTWGELYEEGQKYLKTGESQKAIIVFEKVRVQTEKEVGKKHQYYVKVLDRLVLAYHINGQFDKAKELSLEGLVTQESLVGIDNPEYANLLHSLFDAQFILEDLADAQQTGTKLLAIYKKLSAKKSDNHIILEKTLDKIREKLKKK